MAGPGRQAVLTWTYLRIGVQNELQYRVNFVLSLVQSVIQVGTALIVLALVYSHTDSLGGWSSDELLVVVGVYTLIGGVIRSVIQPNMQQLMADIQEGTLDHVLTKPADAQLLVSIRRISLWPAVDVVVGLVLVAVAMTRLDQTVSLWSLLAFVLALILGAIDVYCIWLLLTSTAFVLVRVEHMVEMFDGLFQAGRWPVGIFPGWLQIGFTFLVPLAFAVTVPASALTGRLSGWLLLGAVAFTTAIVALTRYVWSRSLRRYSGASA